MVLKQAEIMNDKTQTEIRSAEENAIRSDNRNRLMRSQVQPHFLFNVLANIGALCRRDGNPGTADQQLLSKAELLLREQDC